MVPDLPQAELAIVEKTNAFRKTNGLQELKPNPALRAAARAFADYLGQRPDPVAFRGGSP